MAKETGRVISWFPQRNYGFIQRVDGTEIFFHRRAVMSGSKFPEREDVVAFIPGDFQTKKCALAVEVISAVQS